MASQKNRRQTDRARRAPARPPTDRSSLSLSHSLTHSLEREVRLLFSILDRDGNGVISVEEIFERVVETSSATRNADTTIKAEVLDNLKKKPAFATELTLTKFLSSYKMILDELDLFAQVQERRKRRGSLTFMPSFMPMVSRRRSKDESPRNASAPLPAPAALPAARGAKQAPVPESACMTA